MRKYLAALLVFALALAAPASAQYTLNPYVPTYSASSTIANGGFGSNPATDIFCIEGASTGAVRVLRISLAGTSSTSLLVAPVSVVKRSSLNSGGTSTTANPVARDSKLAASTVTFRTYSVNATTLGTLVGTYDSQQLAFLAANTTAAGSPTVFDFTGQGMTLALNGSSEAVCINASSFNTATLGVIITATIQQG